MIPLFPNNLFFTPGTELRTFDVLRPSSFESERGRELINTFIPLGKINAVLAYARPEEIQRWRQLQHTVTHKIIAQGVPNFQITAGDVFEYSQRRFFLQTTPYNPGGLNHFIIYYCQEKSDIQSPLPL